MEAVICTRSTLGPQFIYCYRDSKRKLYSTNLLTGTKSSLRIPGYEFRNRCRLSEMPGGSLLVTGGDTAGEVDRIDTLREHAVFAVPPMLTARQCHTAVYHSQYVYVLGGYNQTNVDCLSECERYVCTEGQWEELPALPVAGYAMSAVVLDNCLYALGGYNFPSDLNTVQQLSLDSLTWELMQLELPYACFSIPCFTTDTEVYLVIKTTLYSFTPLQVKPLMTLPESIECQTSYYSRDTLYYAWHGGIGSLAVGDLTSL
jgi:hypothetical protein